MPQMYSTPLEVRNSAHLTCAPDPKFGVEEEWAASILDGSRNVVAHVYGATADDAIRRAQWISNRLNEAK